MVEWLTRLTMSAAPRGPGATGRRRGENGRVQTPTEVLFIGGRSGIGKTSVAAEIIRQLAAADVQHALIEGDNLDQAHPKPWLRGIPLAEQNLAAMWSNYRAIGYHRLIYSNTVSVLEMDKLSGAFGEIGRVTGVLLCGSDEVAASRLQGREIGSVSLTTYDAARLPLANSMRPHRPTSIGSRPTTLTSKPSPRGSSPSPNGDGEAWASAPLK